MRRGLLREDHGAMKPITAPERCNARVQRLAQVKFVALRIEHTPPSETDRRPPGRLLASLLDSVIRVLGCLEAARP